MKGMRRVQVVVSVVAVVLIVAHLLWPDVAIDSITLTLLVIAIVPWLVPLFKALEFPGGWKVEFQDLERARIRAQDAGLLEGAPERVAAPRYSFQIVADEDPNLALAGLRIEIEKRLEDLATAADLHVKRKGINQLLRVLADSGTLTADQTSVLSDMVGILNAGAHGAVANHLAATWTLNVGPKLLGTLDARISELSA